MQPEKKRKISIFVLKNLENSWFFASFFFSLSLNIDLKRVLLLQNGLYANSQCVFINHSMLNLVQIWSAWNRLHCHFFNCYLIVRGNILFHRTISDAARYHWQFYLLAVVFAHCHIESISLCGKPQKCHADVIKRWKSEYKTDAHLPKQRQKAHFQLCLCDFFLPYRINDCCADSLLCSRFVWHRS